VKAPVTHKELGGRPPIYCFVWDRLNMPGVVVVAMSQAGAILASEFAPTEHQARIEIGLGSIRNHRRYTAEYPNGYILMWVDDGLNNEEIQRIISVNNQINEIVDDAADKLEGK